MKRSTDRILTTHAGSLPRPLQLLAMIRARGGDGSFNAAAFDKELKADVDEIVRQQVECGIDIVSDGELGKPGFATYVLNRLDGFGGTNEEPRGFGDREDFPAWNETAARNAVNTSRPVCNAPLAWKDMGAVETDIANLTAAAKSAGATEAFLPTASIGIVAEIMSNRYYATEEAYLYALADVLKQEYEAIARAGLIIQIDAPDAAMGRHSQFRNEPIEVFRRALAQRTEALNHALQNVPPEQVRYHVCWGNYEGPHTRDVDLRDIVDLVLAVNAQAYSVEAANPRHAHEWRVWQDVKLPEGKLLIPGVIDSCTNYVEHPEVVAERIERYASLVGRENVIAGVDCGFGTFAATPQRVHPEVMWAKFRTLAEGAKLASQRLWR
ncbi:MAG TPA: cobalamin-independent methionine synthase II family protein [Dehalococcoidia bacterium]|nr:cobalamin-independent methionine synthase II family protein [Dehalococcoidia bacterium]